MGYFHALSGLFTRVLCNGRILYQMKLVFLQISDSLSGPSERIWKWGRPTYQLGLTVNCLHANWSWLLLPRFFKIFILVEKVGGGPWSPCPSPIPTALTFPYIIHIPIYNNECASGWVGGDFMPCQQLRPSSGWEHVYCFQQLQSSSRKSD